MLDLWSALERGVLLYNQLSTDPIKAGDTVRAAACSDRQRSGCVRLVRRALFRYDVAPASLPLLACEGKSSALLLCTRRMSGISSTEAHGRCSGTRGDLGQVVA
jgi:hypothetical protein